MLRDMALYDTCREDWARTETRLQLERAALAAQQSSNRAENQTAFGRMARLLAGMTRPDRKAHEHRTPLAS